MGRLSPARHPSPSAGPKATCPPPPTPAGFCPSPHPSIYHLALNTRPLLGGSEDNTRRCFDKAQLLDQGTLWKPPFWIHSTGFWFRKEHSLGDLVVNDEKDERQGTSFWLRTFPLSPEHKIIRSPLKKKKIVNESKRTISRKYHL